MLVLCFTGATCQSRAGCTLYAGRELPKRNGVPCVGSVRHAKARGFASVPGLRNHVEGLISFARQIDKDYAETCARRLQAVQWPF
jgi:hypothetical protein